MQMFYCITMLRRVHLLLHGALVERDELPEREEQLVEICFCMVL
jgi:hypothetical protein